MRQINFENKWVSDGDVMAFNTRNNDLEMQYMAIHYSKAKVIW